jgi:hypothetical protein
VIRRCIEALDATFELTPRWRGAELDRLLDEEHSALQAAWKTRLEAWGWLVLTEVSFNRYGDRGRYDLLAWQPRLRILLVIEIKTELVDVQALVGGLDVKVRVGPVVARQLGWEARSAVVPLLIMSDRSTNRDRIARLGSLFGRFSLHGRSAVGWLRNPSVPAGGMLIFSDLRPANTRRGKCFGRHRIRRTGGHLSVR